MSLGVGPPSPHALLFGLGDWFGFVFYGQLSPDDPQDWTPQSMRWGSFRALHHGRQYCLQPYSQYRKAACSLPQPLGFVRRVILRPSRPARAN